MLGLSEERILRGLEGEKGTDKKKLTSSGGVVSLYRWEHSTLASHCNNK